MSGQGGEYITVYEADKMMTHMLKDYERDVVEPRHRETQNDLAEIKNLVQQGSGAAKLGGAMLTVASIIWIVIQIKTAVGH